MKEATGELSMTAVVVVVIGILAVALPVIINQVTRTMERSANCAAAFACGTCQANGTMTCQYVPEPDEGVEVNAQGTAPITCDCNEADIDD